MSEIKIDKNVWMPGRCGSGDATRKYPFNTMEVGDSFEINGHAPDKVRNSAYAFGRMNNRKFAVRQTGEGSYRCWRIA